VYENCVDGMNCEKNSKYRHTSKFEGHYLDIVEDLLDEDQTMVAVVRQGWTLVLVFGVEWSDRVVDKKDKVWA
jgi:hypothetical protein